MTTPPQPASQSSRNLDLSQIELRVRRNRLTRFVSVRYRANSFNPVLDLLPSGPLPLAMHSLRIVIPLDYASTSEMFCQENAEHFR